MTEMEEIRVNIPSILQALSDTKLGTLSVIVVKLLSSTCI